jgi:2-methylisocitrate lyase-like PEP mutase family enzyme
VTAATDLVTQAERLRELHHGPAPLVLPNVWDVASALAVERAGAAAIATTSSGVAASLGYPDGEAIPVDEMLAAIGRIAAAVSLPVTADLEAGYGLDPAALVAGLLDAGAVGLNLEDTDRSGDLASLTETDVQARRIAAIRRAATDGGVQVVINARIDTFLRGSGSMAARVDEAIQRGRAYFAVGADCVFPIMLAEEDAIGRIVRELEAPVNVLIIPGVLSLSRLAELGVRRISVGGGLARHAMDGVETTARRLLEGDETAFAELGSG